MKKFIVVLLLMLLCITAVPKTVHADPTPNYDDIKLLFTGPFLDYGPFGDYDPELIEDVPRFILTPKDQGPFIWEGRTYLPMRLVFQILGYNVFWRQDSPDIEISKYDETMIINTEEKTAIKDGEIMTLPVLMFNNRNYIPLRSFAEITEDNIYWENDTRTVVYTIRGAKGVMPPVRIIDLQHKEAISSDYHEVNDKIKSALRKGDEISYAVKNVINETIDHNKLIRFSNTWDLAENKNGSNFARTYDAYKGALKPGETTSRQEQFIEYGKYEIVIFGIRDINAYVGRVRSMTSPPDAAGWE